MSSESLGGIDSAASKTWHDAASAQSATEVRGIVGLVRVQLGRALAWAARLSSRADDRRNGIDERKELSRVVDVGSREPHSQGDVGAIHPEVVLGARLAAVGGVRPGLFTPLFARTLILSALARLQSMMASSPNQFSKVACRRCQTPASCQSRNRRQQVTPLPQPSSFGSSRQGQPVRRTKMFPTKAARLGTRGRPPLSLGGSFGSRGSMASQGMSGARDVAFMARHDATPMRL
jgi:hypothetical protein